MPLPALDPHPYGCPMSLAANPAQMPEVITGIVLKVRDLLYPSVHVINPSKGDSYPILNLHADEDDDKPRLVLFPAWEDNKESPKRRIDYGRQMTLLQRIAEAGVRGERIEDWRSEPIDDPSDDPLLVTLATTAGGMSAAVADLLEYLGDHLRLTVTSIEQHGTANLDIVRAYAPTKERKPRLILFPAWSGAVEGPAERLGEAQQREILAHIAKHRLQEMPAEAIVDG